MKRTMALVAAITFYAVSPALHFAFAAGQDDATRLVMQLPTNGSSHNVELEKRIAELVPLALPALEQELRLGIRCKALNELLKANGSRVRRWQACWHGFLVKPARPCL